MRGFAALEVANDAVVEIPANAVPLAPADTEEGDAAQAEADGGGFNREEAFFSLLVQEPDAVAAVTAVQNAVDAIDGATTYFTFANSADLRVNFTRTDGATRVVSRIWWQPSLRGFAGEHGLLPERCLELGARSARQVRDGLPANVRSAATFAIPEDAAALVNVIVQSIWQFRCESGEE